MPLRVCWRASSAVVGAHSDRERYGSCRVKWVRVVRVIEVVAMDECRVGDVPNSRAPSILESVTWYKNETE